MQDIKAAKYWAQIIDRVKYRKDKISQCWMSNDKISKWHNIERQDVERAKYRMQSTKVAKYRTQIIEPKRREKKNIASPVSIMQKIRLGRVGLG